MTSAVILLTVEGPETSKVAQRIASLKGVKEVFSVAGNYDLVAIVHVDANDQLADLVSDHIRSIPGVLSSQTLIAFRSYSAKELAMMVPLD